MVKCQYNPTLFNSVIKKIHTKNRCVNKHKAPHIDRMKERSTFIFTFTTLKGIFHRVGIGVTTLVMSLLMKKIKLSQVTNKSEIDNVVKNISKNETVITCTNREEAEEVAKKIVMKQFNTQHDKEVLERNVTIRDSRVYVGRTKNHTSYIVPGKILNAGKKDTRREFVMYHNHPNLYINGTTPLSNVDIQYLITYPYHSVTALNSAGEYNTATIEDTGKLFPDIICPTYDDKMKVFLKIKKEIGDFAKIYSLGQNGQRLLELRNLKKTQMLTETLESELKILEGILNNSVFDYRTTDMHIYATSLHKAYQTILPKYGIKYETNFSNLTVL